MTDLWSEHFGTDAAMLLVNVLLQTLVVAGLALFAARLLRRRAAVRHCVLCSALIGMMIFPVLAVVFARLDIQIVSFSLPSNPAQDPLPAPTSQPAGISDDPAGPTPEERVVAHAASVHESAHAGSVRYENVDAAPQHERAARGNDSSSVARLDPVTIVACVFSGVWAFGAIVALIGIIRGVWKLRSLFRRTQPCLSEDVRKVADQVCRILNITSLPPIVSSRRVAGPVVAGILRPRIILPSRILPELSEDELRDILLHEMAHVLRRDQLILLLQQLAGALYWLNPLVHVLNRQLARAREEICDNYVLSAVAPADYGETLLHLGQLFPSPRKFADAVGMLNVRWTLENRIAGILDERKTAMTRLQPICGAAIFVSVCVLSFALAGTRIAQAQDPLQLDSEANAKAADSDVSRSVHRAIQSLSKHPVEATPAQHRLNLYAIEIATGKVTLVANEPGRDLTYIGSPSWSPDGRRILFDATPSNKDWGKTRLKLIDTSQTPAKMTDLGPGNCPSWSPDGSRIAYLLNPGVVEGREAGVWVMKSDGRSQMALGGFGCPKWSPDGKKLLVIGFSRPLPLSVMDVKTRMERPIQLAGHKIWSIPSWAGDSNTLVANVHSTTGAGIALIDVSEPEHAKVKQILWRRGDRLEVSPAFPVFSPAAGRCVFVGREKRGMALYSLFVNKYDPPQRLEPEGYDNKIASLALSPDGRYVLFCSDRNPSTDDKTSATDEPNAKSDVTTKRVPVGVGEKSSER